jgi:3-oxoacyl-(acyl-carrier-protein) synthase
MSVRIAGIGLVTPAGRELSRVCEAVVAGSPPTVRTVQDSFHGREFPIVAIDPALVDDVARMPRLRRAGGISLFAVAAALDALRHAGPADDRLALVFATTNGGVVHTRRFFHDVSERGTHAGSPLLFPETVYNAPASHIAAAAGLTGTVTTLVNDASAGIDALVAATQLIDEGSCDRCLVVAAEEADWVVCEACDAWRLAESDATPFGEGAAALLLTREKDGPRLEVACPPSRFRSVEEAAKRFASTAPDGVELLVTSGSGRIFDAAEPALAPGVTRLAPKRALGEAFAASALMQVAIAAAMIEEFPRALATVTGFHGQQASVLVSRS